MISDKDLSGSPRALPETKDIVKVDVITVDLIRPSRNSSAAVLAPNVTVL